VIRIVPIEAFDSKTSRQDVSSFPTLEELNKINQEKKRQELLKYRRDWSKKNYSNPVAREKINAYQRAYNSKPSIKQKSARYSKEYYSQPGKKEHAAERMSEYYRRGDNRRRILDAGKKWKDEVWCKVFNIYGWSCACCGESNTAFLTIDHIKEDGWRDRRENSRSLGRIVKENDRTKYQILCYNCNCARSCRSDGTCPHKLPNGGEFNERATRQRVEMR
jgi:hypothetical protein